MDKSADVNFRKVQWVAFEDEITLYWDLPEGIRVGVDKYQIWINNKLTGETSRSHYCIKELQASTNYEVEIYIVRDSKTLDYIRIHCNTKQAKECIDVTHAPYYAIGDGKTLNTEVLQQAINDCTPGQKVYFPKGVYLTGALRLHSDMELYLEEGAVLKGTAEPDDYLPRIWSRFEGKEMETYSGLLNLGEIDHTVGATCGNVIIRGKGTIEGGGRPLMERVIETERIRLKDYLEELGDKILECENSDTIPGRVRPRLLHICNARNVTISGVTLKNGASWNVHMIYSEDILTYGCHFYSRNIWNGDGWDPDSSRNCTIFGCTFDTGDDAIAIKSGKNPEGNEINRPCEHIRIFDCVVEFGHGFAMGSEMSGGIRDVKIWNCDLRKSAYGIEIKGTRKRGGYVREVHAKHCVLPRILVHSVGYNDDGIAGPHPPIFENCSFEDMEITRSALNEMEERMEPCEAIELSGFEEPEYNFRNLKFKNFRIVKNGQKDDGIQQKYCKNVLFEDIKYE